MAAKLVLVGQVAGAFGVRGEVRINAFTEKPATLLAYKRLLNENGEPTLDLGDGRVVQNAIIAETEPRLTREEAQAMSGLQLYIDRSRLPPPEDENEFYLADLVGLAVFSPEGIALGHVRLVANFGAGDLLEIAPAGSREPSWFVPFTREIVPEIDLEGGRVVVGRPFEMERRSQRGECDQF